MTHFRHGLRDRLFHGHSDNDPYDYHNWGPAPPLGGNRPFPIPPTPSESSGSASGDEKVHGVRERVRRHKKKVRSRSRSRHRHHHHGHHRGDSTPGEKIEIDDTPMDEAEKNERMGIMRGRGGHEMVSSGSEGGVGVPIPEHGSEVGRSESKRERREHKHRKERKSDREQPDSPRQAIPLPVRSAPIIMTTPATPDGDPHRGNTVKKQRSTTLPVGSASASSFFPTPGETESSSRHSSIAAGMPWDEIDTPPVLYSSATLPRGAIPMPPYPATPPPIMAGQDYISPSPPSTSALVYRVPTILRPGVEHEHHHSRHHSSWDAPPRDSAVEIGEGRELRHTDSSRSIKTRPRTSTLPGGSNLVYYTNANGEVSSPTSQMHTSYRDSILSTFSHRGSELTRSPELTRSLSTKSTATTTPPLSPAARRPIQTSSHLTEDYLSILKSFDTIFIIDDSPSMLYESRWSDTASALGSISEIATRYDSDGIDIHFLNSPERDVTGVRSAEQVKEIFSSHQPPEGGSTPLGSRLDGILRAYLDRYSLAREAAGQSTPTPAEFSKTLSSLIKPLNIVVITDGDATDDPESVIVSVARELDRLNAPLAQVGIQMFQVGGDSEAAEFLRGLDDDLVKVYDIRDMVDTTPFRGTEEGNFTGEEMLKVLVGAVNRRVDRRENYRVDYRRGSRS